MSVGEVLASAAIAYVWPFLFAGMVVTWRDRLEGRSAGVAASVRNGQRSLVKAIGWGVQSGVFAIIVLALLHLPLIPILADGAVFAGAFFHEAVILPLNLWIFFAYLLPLAIARVAGYETWRGSQHRLALALIGLPLAASLYLPFEVRTVALYVLLPFYALAVETLAQGQAERPAREEAPAA